MIRFFLACCVAAVFVGCGGDDEGVVRVNDGKPDAVQQNIQKTVADNPVNKQTGAAVNDPIKGYSSGGKPHAPGQTSGGGTGSAILD